MPERVARLAFASAAALAGVALVGVMVLTVLDFSLRFSFNAPIPGTFELTELAMIGIAFLGLGQAQQRQQHITIDLLYELLGRFGRQVIDRAARAVCLLLALVTAWQLWAYLLRARADAEVSGVLRVPLFVVVGAALVGFGLYAVALFVGGAETSDVA